MTTLFTSDTHLGHDNIRGYSNRPFSTVEEMDNAIIQNWNEKVGEKDKVYHLGDFTLKDYRHAANYFRRLNGEIFVLPGSHDGYWINEDVNYVSKTGQFVTVLPPIVALEFPNYGTGKYPLTIVLCHYSMRTWQVSHYGSLHLYGHSHGRLAGTSRSMDIGVDCHNFYPLTLEEVIERLGK